MRNSPQTLVAAMTPRGRGAVAVIRVAGDLASSNGGLPFRAVNGRPLSSQPVGKIVFGQWGNDAHEDVVICRLEERTLEVHCHGGEQAVERILADCETIGAARVPWQQLVSATADFLAAELWECLGRAITWQTAEYLLRQTNGIFRSACERLRQTEWTVSGRQDADERIAEMLQWAEFGRHLTEPWRVVLTGPPNVGKSSLMNALLGYERSIVFDQPGTTRDVVHAVTAFEGWPVQLSDTAGLRSDANELEAAGIERARRELLQADLIVTLIDVSAAPHELDEADPSKGILVAHKCDLPDAWGRSLPSSAWRVSSVTQQGLKALEAEIVRRLIPKLPTAESPLPLTQRQVEVLRAMQSALQSSDDERFYAW
jgi:tRNA modification GTPase